MRLEELPSSPSQGMPDEGDGRTRGLEVEGVSCGEVGVCPCATAEMAATHENMDSNITVIGRVKNTVMSCLSLRLKNK